MNLILIYFDMIKYGRFSRGILSKRFRNLVPVVGANMSRASFGPTIGKLRIVHIPEAGVLRDVPRGCKILACTILCGLTAPWANRLTSMDTRKNLQVWTRWEAYIYLPF